MAEYGERSVIISPDQQITSEDLTDIGLHARASLDHVVADAVGVSKKFKGFVVIASGPAQVTVGQGRLFDGGKVYGRDDATDFVKDLATLLPAVTNKIVSVVVYGQEIDTELEPRTFLVDVDTEETASQVQSTVRRRVAQLSFVAGLEAPDPAPPILDANVIAVAHVRLSPSGIQSVTRVDANLRGSLDETEDATRALNDFRNRAGSRLDTLDSNFASVTARLKTMPSKRQVFEIAQDVARLKELAELTDDYTSYGADRFLNEDESDTEHVDYLAKVSEGIRFPPASQRSAQLALLNPIDPTVTVTDNMVLPKWTEVERQLVTGRDGELSVSQYQHTTTQMVRRTVARERIRYGGSRDYCTNVSWYGDGRTSVAVIFGRTGEEPGIFYESSLIPKDPEDYYSSQMIRVREYWVDKYEEEYWDAVTVEEGADGARMARTWLCSEDGYLTSIGLYFTRVANTGDVTVLIGEAPDGRPDKNKIIGRATIAAANLKLHPVQTKIPLPPILQRKGKRYSVFITTPGNHFLAKVNRNGGANGTFFYSLDDAWYQGDLQTDIPFSLYYARFSAPYAEVQLQPLTLDGGIHLIDLNYDKLGPENTRIIWQVQVAGVWRTFGADDITATVGLPPLLPLRALLTGTTEVMPAFGVGIRSEARTERARPDFKHISTARPQAVPVDTVEVTFRLEGWDPARHTAVAKLLVGAGFTTVEAHDVVETTPTNIPNAIIRKWTFNLAAPVSNYKIRLDGTTDNVLVQFHGAERFDLSYT